MIQFQEKKLSDKRFIKDEEGKYAQINNQNIHVISQVRYAGIIFSFNCQLQADLFMDMLKIMKLPIW